MRERERADDDDIINAYGEYLSIYLFELLGIRRKVTTLCLAIILIKQITMDAIEEQRIALESCRGFLKGKSLYDILPVSYRMVVLETGLPVKRALNVLIQNKILSAPLWDSEKSRFAGLLTLMDFIGLVQYFFSNPDKIDVVDKLRLGNLKEIENSVGIHEPLEECSIQPERSLFEACQMMLESRTRKIPLLDKDEVTDRELVVGVLTQYRILKFLAMNYKDAQLMHMPLSSLNISTTTNLKTCKMETPLIDTIQMMTTNEISSIPIVDNNNVLLNAYESSDILGLIKGGIYNDLSLCVGEALMRRSDDHEGIYTCTVDDKFSSILDIIRKSRIHRFFIVDKEGKLQGILTLGDILRYIIEG